MTPKKAAGDGGTVSMDESTDTPDSTRHDGRDQDTSNKCENDSKIATESDGAKPTDTPVDTLNEENKKSPEDVPGTPLTTADFENHQNNIQEKAMKAVQKAKLYALKALGLDDASEIPDTTQFDRKGMFGLGSRGGTAIVTVGRMCIRKDPVCETFCTNKGSKIFVSVLIRVQ